MASGLALYPGTFDPLTLGHRDIIDRAAGLFAELVIGVAVSEAKAPLLPLAERLALAAEEAAPIAAARGCRIRVVPLQGLMVALATALGAAAVVRGLRGVSDFDYEYQMAGTNRQLAPGLETVFLMADPGTQCLSSTLVRQIARLGGDFSGFVPAATHARMLACLRG